MNDIVAPLIRRAILDLLNDIGGEQNHEVLALLLRNLGHRIATSDVAATLSWLAERALVKAEPLGPYTVARILRDGRDVANGELFVDGVSRHKTGE